MLYSTVDQARLLNRPNDAAQALLEKQLLETPINSFDSLRMLKDDWLAFARSYENDAREVFAAAQAASYLQRVDLILAKIAAREAP